MISVAIAFGRLSAGKSFIIGGEALFGYLPTADYHSSMYSQPDGED
jgi:hypothetical protein